MGSSEAIGTEQAVGRRADPTDVAPPELPAVIREHLEVSTRGTVTLHDLRLETGGHSREQYRVAAHFESGECRGEAVLWMIADGRVVLPGCLGALVEAAVINEAAAFGVRTPRARWTHPSLLGESRGVFFVEAPQGEPTGRTTIEALGPTEAGAAVLGEIVTELATLHRITPEQVPELALDRTTPPWRRALSRLEQVLDILDEPRPDLHLVARWLREHAPGESEPRVLLHGDLRGGTYLLGRRGLDSLIGWSEACFGPPEAELAWFCLRDWRFGALRRGAGGLAPRAVLYEKYEGVTARRLDRDRLRWYEVWGNAWLAAQGIFRGERYLRGEVHRIEALAVARRACKMSFEALRLMEATGGWR